MADKLIYCNSLTTSPLLCVSVKTKDKINAMNVVRSLIKVQNAKGHGKNDLHRLQKKIAAGTLTENEAMIAVLKTYNYKSCYVVGDETPKQKTHPKHEKITEKNIHKHLASVDIREV